MIATTNIHEELGPEEFFPIFHDFSSLNPISTAMPLSESFYASCIPTQSLFTVSTSDACLHGIQPLNKFKLPGTIPYNSYVDDWFDTGQDFEVDLCVLLSIDSEETTQVSHECFYLLTLKS